MAQTLSVLYGELISDQSVAKNTLSRDGILIKFLPTFPSPTALTIAPIDAVTGRVFAWKTCALASSGPFVIAESAAVTGIIVPAVDGKYWLVGRWKWVAGPVDIHGVPTGVHTTDMNALYSVEAAPSDWIGTGTVEEPQLNNRLDGDGRYGVILGRITVASGVPTFSWEPSTLTDMAYIGSHLATLAQNSDVITLKSAVNDLILAGCAFLKAGSGYALDANVNSPMIDYNFDTFFSGTSANSLTCLKECVLEVTWDAQLVVAGGASGGTAYLALDGANASTGESIEARSILDNITSSDTNRTLQVHIHGFTHCVPGNLITFAASKTLSGTVTMVSETNIVKCSIKPAYSVLT